MDKLFIQCEKVHFSSIERKKLECASLSIMMGELKLNLCETGLYTLGGISKYLFILRSLGRYTLNMQPRPV